MELSQLRKYVSVAAVALAAVHVLWPSLGIDFVTISLVVVAIIPWILPVLKSLELPGGVKIEFKDVKQATEKVTQVTIQPANATHRVTSAGAELALQPQTNDPLATLRHIASTDPKLAFVGFRIEVEKRILAIAERAAVQAQGRPLTRIVRDLQEREILPGSVASGLSDLIALGNRVAHGVDVAPEAVDWLLDVGPSLLGTLDDALNSMQNEKVRQQITAADGLQPPLIAGVMPSKRCTSETNSDTLLGCLSNCEVVPSRRRKHSTT
jgi:hypothetical protein